MQIPIKTGIHDLTKLFLPNNDISRNWETLICSLGNQNCLAYLKIGYHTFNPPLLSKSKLKYFKVSQITSVCVKYVIDLCVDQLNAFRRRI